MGLHFSNSLGKWQTRLGRYVGQPQRDWTTDLCHWRSTSQCLEKMVARHESSGHLSQCFGSCGQRKVKNGVLQSHCLIGDACHDVRFHKAVRVDDYNLAGELLVQWFLSARLGNADCSPRGSGRSLSFLFRG
ncbi:hypothetical protein HHK36_000336 [Tetracentron sinense]|uniref:Uncharacterized protein n=1 Tax=Tetracentron sinense TaxID=13715 RepID=A0A835A1G0_TETSI|nr:hypothetical protein HHK36_000336 [Tetracentron sinense]